MHILNKRASTFPLTTTISEPNPHHHHHHSPQQQQEQQHQLDFLTTTISATLPGPRASSCSEHGFSSAATITPRTSCSDEAQACFNLLLILRADTQHLISLRNDNLDILEHTSQARPLLHNINDILAAAARSIAELGPFLERHRWPVICDPKTKCSVEARDGKDGGSGSQQQQSRYSLRPVFMRRSKGPTTAAATSTKRRRRCKSLSNSLRTTAAGKATPPSWEEEAGWLSPEGLFSWTLELTAQHTAALVALDRLERFLAYGIAVLRIDQDVATAAAEDPAKEKEGTARRERASWWDQQRGEFENVGLIQSLLTGPRRTRLSGGGGGGDAPSKNATAAAAIESRQPANDGGVSSSDHPATSEQHDDGRSMTIVSEPPSELSTSTSHWGLTARPRVSPRTAAPLPDGDEELAVRSARRVVTEPVSPRTPPQPLPGETPQLTSRSETFGQPGLDAKSSPSTTRLPLSRFSSLKQRPRIATQPLLPLVGLPALLPTSVGQGTVIPSTHNNNNNSAVNNTNLLLPTPAAGGSFSPSSALSATTPLFSPLLYTPGGNGQQGLSPSSQLLSPSPGGVGTPSTPLTPVDQHLMTLIEQKALPSKSKTIQPVVREQQQQMENGGGGLMVVSPVESHEAMHVMAGAAFEYGVSPITATTISGGHYYPPSPRKGSLVSISSSILHHHQQRQHQVVDARLVLPSHNNKKALKAGQHHDEGGEEGDDYDDDKHWPYLAYMARKQAVATSRWSLRRSGTTASDSG